MNRNRILSLDIDHPWSWDFAQRCSCTWRLGSESQLLFPDEVFFSPDWLLGSIEKNYVPSSLVFLSFAFFGSNFPFIIIYSFYPKLIVQVY